MIILENKIERYSMPKIRNEIEYGELYMNCDMSSYPFILDTDSKTVIPPGFERIEEFPHLKVNKLEPSNVEIPTLIAYKIYMSEIYDVIKETFKSISRYTVPLENGKVAKCCIYNISNRCDDAMLSWNVDPVILVSFDVSYYEDTSMTSRINYTHVTKYITLRALLYLKYIAGLTTKDICQVFINLVTNYWETNSSYDTWHIGDVQDSLWDIYHSEEYTLDQESKTSEVIRVSKLDIGRERFENNVSALHRALSELHNNFYLWHTSKISCNTSTDIKYNTSTEVIIHKCEKYINMYIGIPQLITADTEYELLTDAICKNYTPCISFQVSRDCGLFNIQNNSQKIAFIANIAADAIEDDVYRVLRFKNKEVYFEDKPCDVMVTDKEIWIIMETNRPNIGNIKYKISLRAWLHMRYNAKFAPNMICHILNIFISSIADFDITAFSVIPKFNLDAYMIIIKDRLKI